MRISGWSADVCSSDLVSCACVLNGPPAPRRRPTDTVFPPFRPHLCLIGLPQRPPAYCSMSGRDIHDHWPSSIGASCLLPKCPTDRTRLVKGKGVPGRVDIGGRRIFKKKITHKN